jgi:hypothetical protein
MSAEDEAPDLGMEEAHDKMVDEIINRLAREMTFAEVVQRLLGTLPLEAVAEIADGRFDRLPKPR